MMAAIRLVAACGGRETDCKGQEELSGELEIFVCFLEWWLHRCICLEKLSPVCLNM